MDSFYDSFHVFEGTGGYFYFAVYFSYEFFGFQISKFFFWTTGNLDEVFHLSVGHGDYFPTGVFLVQCLACHVAHGVGGDFCLFQKVQVVHCASHENQIADCRNVLMVYSVVFPDRECGHRKEVLDVLDVKKFFDFQLSSIGYAHREPTNCVFIGHDMVRMRHVWGTLHLATQRVLRYIYQVSYS